MKNKILLALFAIFLVIVGGLLIFGVTTHTEPTLMKVCWTNDIMTFVEDGLEEENSGPCAEPQELVWAQEQIPVSVSAKPYEKELDFNIQSQLDTAISLINSQLGYKHLVYRSAKDPAGGENADIRVVYGYPYQTGDGTTRADRAAGVCTIERYKPTDTDNNRMGNNGLRRGNIYYLRGEIRVRDVSDSQLAYYVLIHELGHCGLGLAHDLYHSSPMYPLVKLDKDRLKFIYFSDTDRKKLRSIYGKGK